MEPLATVDDLVALWRALDANERARAESLLGVASAVLRQACPTVDDQITAGTLAAEIPKWIVCQMVKRVMASSADLPPVSQQSQSVGAVSTSYTLVNPTGDLYLAKSERKMLGLDQQQAATVSMIQVREV